MITIVIADDEKLIRAGIKKNIEKTPAISCCNIEAKNGEEALNICKEENPDLIITDIRMPKMDGIELMKNLSNLEEKPAIIVLSGFDDFSYAKEAISCGAISYILKPVDSQELIAAINNAIASVNQEEKRKTKKSLNQLQKKVVSILLNYQKAVDLIMGCAVLLELERKSFQPCNKLSLQFPFMYWNKKEILFLL